MQSGAGILNIGSEPTQISWYAVYTKHQHEKNAADILAKKGFEVLLPLYKTAHRWKDRSQAVLLPLFPCYVFLQMNLEKKLEALRTPGIFWFVGNGGRASAIPINEIDAIRRATQSPVRLEPHPFLNSGDRVRIKDGALAGLEGYLTRFKNQYRVVLSVELLQKAVAVEVDIATVQPVAAPHKFASSQLSDSKRTA
jgi:transcription antitermination factor NusG